MRLRLVNELISYLTGLFAFPSEREARGNKVKLHVSRLRALTLEFDNSTDSSAGGDVRFRCLWTAFARQGVEPFGLFLEDLGDGGALDVGDGADVLLAGVGVFDVVGADGLAICVAQTVLGLAMLLAARGAWDDGGGGGGGWGGLDGRRGQRAGAHWGWTMCAAVVGAVGIGGRAATSREHVCGEGGVGGGGGWGRIGEGG